MSGSPLLVLGIGDVLQRDDGLGVEAVRLLLELRQPGTRVRVVDGGTLGLGLLGVVTEARDVLVVGALHVGGRAASLVCLDGPAAERALAVAAPRESREGLGELFDAARRLGRMPARLVAVGLVPARVEPGASCSPPIRRALPLLVDAIVHEARALGYRLPRRRPPGRRDAGRSAA
jgi:hydrogenase maturation protease